MKKLLIFMLVIFCISCNANNKERIEYFSKNLEKSEIDKEVLMVASFNEKTIWPVSNNFTDEINPKNILEWGSTPYLNIGKIHAKGITGKNIHIAIIDGTLNSQHEDFSNCLYKYYNVGEKPSINIHGTIVASICCGKGIGVAPDAKLHYYAAVPKDKYDVYDVKTKALRRILEYNEKNKEKIRIISISIGRIEGIPGYEDFYSVIKELESRGVMVFFVSAEQKINAMVKFPFLGDRNDISKLTTQNFYDYGVLRKLILLFRYRDEYYLPCAGFTVADFDSIDRYLFIGESSWGNSWVMPMIAGIAALALEVDSQLAKEDFFNLLYKTSDDFYMGKIPNPLKLIEAVENRRIQT